MLRSKLWLALPMVLASIALAQIHAVQGARGEGVARSENGIPGHFAFDVKKVFHSNTSFEVGGKMRFVSETPATNTHEMRRVVIEMPRAHVFGMHGNTAEFAGPAAIHIRTGDRTIDRRGRLMVWVQDNREPTSTTNTNPDLIRIRFIVEHSTTDFYHYAGKVHRGDIDVYSRR